MAGKIQSDFPDLWAKYKHLVPKYENLSAEIIKKHGNPAPLTGVPHGINVETLQLRDIVEKYKEPAKDYTRTMPPRKLKNYAQPFPWEEIKQLPVGQAISRTLGTKNLLGAIWLRTVNNMTGFKMLLFALGLNGAVGYLTIARQHYKEHPAYKYK